LRLFGAAAAGSLFERYASAQAALTLQPLSDKITVLMGAGGNITILKSADGLLLVDAGLPNTVAAVLAKLKDVAPAPVKLLINTHWHYDHTGGNEELGKSGTQILAHVNCLKRLSATQHIAFFNRDFPALAEVGRPKQTFQDKGQLSFGGETVRYQYLPPAHTDGDITVHFANDDVYAAGDLHFNGMYPFIDYSTGGSIEGMIRNAATMLKAVGAKTKIVPGHGPLATKADLQAFHDMLADANEQLSKLIKQGKSIDEIVAAKPTAKYDDKWGNGFVKADAWLRMLHAGRTT